MTPLYFMAFHGVSKLSRLIRFCTRSDYSHIAICTDVASMTLIEPWAHDGGIRQWWDVSSVNRHSPGTKWELWGIEVDDKEYRYCMSRYHTYADNKLKYDWRGVIGFEIQFVKDSSEKLFCSEGAIKPLATWRRLTRVFPERVSPADFIALIQAMGGRCVMTGVVEARSK